jgi:hypothetical protein
MPAAKGNELRVQGLSGVGKTGLMKFLIRERKDFSKESRQLHLSNICVWSWLSIELLYSDEDKALDDFVSSVLREVAKVSDELEDSRKSKRIKSIIKDIKAKKADSKKIVWNDMIELLRILTLEVGVNIVIVLDDFHEIFKLESKERSYYVDILLDLHKVFPPKITFVFINSLQINDGLLRALGRLRILFTKNVFWWKFGDEDSTEAIIKDVEHHKGGKVSSDMKKWIIQNTGGDPTLIKRYAEEFIRNKRGNNNMGISQWTIEDAYNFVGKDFMEARFERLLGFLQPKSIDWLLKKDTEPPDFLIESGLIYQKKSKYVLYSRLLDYYMSHNKENVESLKQTIVKESESTNQINRKTSVETKKGLTKLMSKRNDKHSNNKKQNYAQIKTYLTGQELIVMEVLLKDEGKVVKKEKLAKTVWGEDWADEYSQWALDKMISRLRKKLQKHNYEKVLKSVRGKGVVLT